MNAEENCIGVLILENEFPQVKRLKRIVAEAALTAGVVQRVKVGSTVEGAYKILEDGFVPNLVVLDHGLDGKGNGVEFLKRLIDGQLRCHVLVLSSRLMQESATGQEIWRNYGSLLSSAEEAGIRVCTTEKDSEKTDEAWIIDAVSNFAKATPKGRTIQSRALKSIIAKSPAMSQGVQSIRVFLESWQTGRSNLLILHGNHGAGKRFIAQQVGEAAGIKRISHKFEREEGHWLQPANFEKGLRSLKTLSMSDGEEGFNISFPDGLGTDNWSQIIPDMSDWSRRTQIAQLAITKIAKYPRHLFIWICETSWWEEIRIEVENSLQRVMTAVRIPNLKEREGDVVLLAKHFCDMCDKGNFTLDQPAKSALQNHGPDSVAQLYTGIMTIVNNLPSGAKHISVSDLPRPWIGAVKFAQAQVPERPSAITAKCEDRVVKLLQAQRAIFEKKSQAKPLAFGKKFEQEFVDEDCRIVIRAVAWVSARLAWNGANVHTNRYVTLFIRKKGRNLKWPAICKDSPRGTRDIVKKFAERHEQYLLQLASYGPPQPRPS